MSATAWCGWGDRTESLVFKCQVPCSRAMTILIVITWYLLLFLSISLWNFFFFICLHACLCFHASWRACVPCTAQKPRQWIIPFRNEGTSSRAMPRSSRTIEASGGMCKCVMLFEDGKKVRGRSSPRSGINNGWEIWCCYVLVFCAENHIMVVIALERKNP